MISVIVPVYNAAQYLEQCVRSICTQTYKDIEIILVDDGSDDGSLEMCEIFQKQDARIKVIHKENGGPVSARKVGISHASGEYIAFVDADDWIEADMYERMYQKIVEQNVDIVLCGYYEDTGNTSKKMLHRVSEGRYDKKALLQEIYPKMIVNHDFFEWGIFPSECDKLFKRECIYPFQMDVDERIVMGDDAACVYPCFLHAASIYVMHQYFYHYRQSLGSVVKRVKNPEIERMQFQALYRTVMNKFAADKDIYDLQPQWKKYVLFLMIPRADSLYEGIGQLNFLFPFPNVSKGARIILYGAGTYGQRLFSFLKRTGFCHVAVWVDRNYAEFQKMGLPVENPALLSEYADDAVDVVVAITFAKPRFSLYRELQDKYPGKRIHLIEEELIFSEETVKAMGL
ncbi:MAG: glycosyltransferase [Muribaculaceae bacterium]|nr:glycosyltransferase [Muribaculaceae bacterium]